MASSRIKISRLIAAIFFTTVIFLSPVYAAWWDFKNDVIPPNTVEQNKQTRKINGSDFTFAYYVSTLDAGSIKNFYRDKLAHSGWVERNLEKELTNILKVEKDASRGEFLDYTLLFEKEKKTLVVTFVPAGVIQDGKTRFSVSEGTMDFNKAAGEIAAQDYAPALLTGPKKDITPKYPGASLINFSEQTGHLTAVYYTKDEIEQVLTFYKNNLPQDRWVLVNEMPPQRIDLNELYSRNQDFSDCPTCPKKEFLSQSLTDVSFAELTFNNNAGDICRIGVTKNILNKDNSSLASSLNFTTIRVSYEKKP